MISSLKNKGWIFFILIVLVYFLGVFLRLEYGKAYRGRIFNSESALRFNYSRMVSRGESIPEIDRKAQYPEGLSVKARNPVLLEYVLGYLYRFFGKEIPFDIFVRVAMPVIASLSIIAVCLLVREVTAQVLPGLIAGCFYAVSSAAVSRSCGWEFVHETIALPFIFFHIYFFIKYFRLRKISHIFTSGVFLFLGLFSWKITQFYYLIFSASIATWVLFARNTAMSKLACKAFLVILAFSALAGLTIPYLKTGGFICSLPMITSFSLALQCFLILFNIDLRFWRIFGFFIVIFLLILILPQSPNYSHVYNLLLYKALFFIQKPLDPNMLPFDVKAVWEEPGVRPTPYEVVYYFLPLAFLAIVPLTRSVVKSIRSKLNFSESFILYNFFSFLFLYLLVRRIRVFLIFFLVVYLGIFLSRIISKKRRLVYFVVFLSFICLGLESYKTLGYHRRNIFNEALASVGMEKEFKTFEVVTISSVDEDLIEWINRNITEEEVILTHYNISSMIRAYSKPQVILNSLFESNSLRKKIKKFIYTLYSDERSFYELCKLYAVDYFIYTIDTVLDDSLYSWRYLANYPELKDSVVAYKMHFLPERLKNFSLVYQNECYRVYKVTEGREQISIQKHLKPHLLMYRHDIYSDSNKSMSEFYNYIKKVFRFYSLGIAYYESDQLDEAMKEFKKSLDVMPEFSLGYLGMGIVFESRGNIDGAVDAYRRFVQLHPKDDIAKRTTVHIDKLMKP